MKLTLLITTIVISTAIAVGQSQTPKAAVVEPANEISFPTEDGGLIHALEYGKGKHAVVLVHGGRFRKESWSKQAPELVMAGFRVVAIDLRSYGKSTGPGQSDIFTAPIHLDVLAAVSYLRKNGAKTVSIVGGSLGGGAGADAATFARPGEISGLVTLGGLMGGKRPEDVKVRLLVITTRNDANADGLRLPKIQAAFDKVPGKKELVVLEGSAHAQFMFDTDLADDVMARIIKFLSDVKR
jgi:alpha-beta hydrolase superfamily lysophospholipase